MASAARHSSNIGFRGTEADLRCAAPGERRSVRRGWEGRRRHVQGFHTILLGALVATLGTPRATAQTEPGASSAPSGPAASRPEVAASEADRDRIAPSDTLARYAPAGARSFVYAQRLANLDAVVQQTHCAPLVRKVAEAGGVDPALLDLRARLAAFLNLTSSLDRARLARMEVAMVSTGPADAASAVWLARPFSASVLTDWFPAARRTAETTNNDVVSFATDDGFTVCVRRELVAMGRRQRGRSILREVYNQLTADPPGARSLAQAAGYRLLDAELPPGDAARMFLSSGGARNAIELPWSSMTIEQALLGVYAPDGSLQLSARGVHGEKTAPPMLPSPVVDAFRRLPAATHAAVTVRMEPAQLQSRLGPLYDMVRRLPSFRPEAEAGPESTRWQSRIEDVGPDMILLWGPSPVSEAGVPPLAAMVRCRDARALRSDVSLLFSEVIRWIGRIEDVPEEKLPKFKLITHLGTPILYVFPGEPSRDTPPGWWAALRAVTPAWAAWGEWFVVATSVEHVQSLLDAQHGLAPTLAALPELRRIVQEGGEYAGIGMVQPAMAAAALQRWSAMLEPLPADHWLSAWWTDAVRLWEGSEDHVWLDAYEFFGQRGSGTAVVSRIDANADARKTIPFQTGDLVIGVDDRLLALHDPLDTLEDAWEPHGEGRLVKVRVMRSGRALELDVVPGSVERAGGSALPDTPYAAARLAADWMRGLTFAGWSWRFGGEQRFAADLVLTCVRENP